MDADNPNFSALAPLLTALKSNASYFPSHYWDPVFDSNTDNIQYFSPLFGLVSEYLLGNQHYLNKAKYVKSLTFKFTTHLEKQSEKYILSNKLLSLLYIYVKYESAHLKKDTIKLFIKLLGATCEESTDIVEVENDFQTEVSKELRRNSINMANVAQYFRSPLPRDEAVCLNLFENVPDDLFKNIWFECIKKYDPTLISMRVIGITKQIAAHFMIPKIPISYYENLLLYYIDNVSLASERFELLCMDADFMKGLSKIAVEPTYQEVCTYLIGNFKIISRNLSSITLPHYERVIKKLIDEQSGEAHITYSTTLHDDKWVYHEISKLYDLCICANMTLLSKSIALLSTQVIKHPNSIGKQLYLLSVTASECFCLPTKKLKEPCFKEVLTFILELVLGTEKLPSADSSKRITSVLRPYFEFFSIIRKLSPYWSDVVIRVIKCLSLLKKVNKDALKKFASEYWTGFRVLSDFNPGPWINDLMERDIVEVRSRNQASSASIQNNFESAIINSLYAPKMAFDVSAYQPISTTVYNDEVRNGLAVELAEELLEAWK